MFLLLRCTSKYCSDACAYLKACCESVPSKARKHVYIDQTVVCTERAERPWGWRDSQGHQASKLHHQGWQSAADWLRLRQEGKRAGRGLRHNALHGPWSTSEWGKPSLPWTDKLGHAESSWGRSLYALWQVQDSLELVAFILLQYVYIYARLFWLTAGNRMVRCVQLGVLPFHHD